MNSPLSDSIKMHTTVVVTKGFGGLGSCCEGGGCGLPSVDKQDFVKTAAVPEWDAVGLAPVKPSRDPMVCLTVRPVFVRPAIGTMCQGLER